MTVHHYPRCQFLPSAMLTLFNIFVQIILRRLGPEDLPDSRFLLGMVAVAFVIVQTLVGLPAFGAGSALWVSLALDLALLCAFPWALLWFAGHPGRYGRTLTALLGTGTILSLLILPFIYLLIAGDPGNPSLVPRVGILGVVVWSLIVNGHILSRALSAPLAVGIVIAIAWFLISYLVSVQFGAAPE